ncbi:hypothetical protein FC81_GL001477 [Liquorilactobacillus capillatus DSM 19910]|uniref:Uncharacterized protein n=2 Tax=Liquorilactobacillus capillatus TaxID=480931 RepID=A0A0R1LZZ8_9LACO|nr:hypothetical protein FC81_GL001477 [Liquorilactobacillus capillatus DSM 19910]
MVNDYLRRSNDRNPLHRGTRQIVPGNLLLEKVEEYCTEIKQTAVQSLCITFLHPLYSEEEIVIKIEDVAFRISWVKDDREVLLAKGRWK